MFDGITQKSHYKSKCIRNQYNVLIPSVSREGSGESTHMVRFTRAFAALVFMKHGFRSKTKAQTKI